MLRLGQPRVALYQIHWDLPLVSDQTWLADLAEAYDRGLIGAVGVSNYGPRDLRAAHRMLADQGVALATNQSVQPVNPCPRAPLTESARLGCDRGLRPLAQASDRKYAPTTLRPSYADCAPTEAPASKPLIARCGHRRRPRRTPAGAAELASRWDGPTPSQTAERARMRGGGWTPRRRSCRRPARRPCGATAGLATLHTCSSNAENPLHWP